MFIDLGPPPAEIAQSVPTSAMPAVIQASHDREKAKFRVLINSIDDHDRPLPTYLTSRNGTKLSLREYGNGQEEAVILIHGSAGESLFMHPLARAFQEKGAHVYVPDIRGHGLSGRHGDIDYIGQLDDDFADLVDYIRKRQPNARITVIGFSAGGAFVLRLASGRYADIAQNYIMVSPAIVDLRRPDEGWTKDYIGNIILAKLSNVFGYHGFDRLKAVQFSAPNDSGKTTTDYSYRLLMNFSALDYKTRLPRITKPISLYAGTEDEQFFARCYQSKLTPYNKALKVTLVEGVAHIGMAIDPKMMNALIAQWQGSRDPVKS